MLPALKDIFVKNDSEKACINGYLDRLEKFDLKLVYRLSTDHYINIGDELSRMPTRILTLSENQLGESMLMALMKVEL